MQSIAFQLERLCIGQTFSPWELQVWKLSDFQTVPEVFEAFSKVSAVPSEIRRWHGSKKEARASSMAFSRFKNGLAAEVRNRMDALGSTMAAVVRALEWNVSAFPPPGQSARCSSYAAGTAVTPGCLASASRAAEHAFDSW